MTPGSQPSKKVLQTDPGLKRGEAREGGGYRGRAKERFPTCFEVQMKQSLLGRGGYGALGS